MDFKDIIEIINSYKKQPRKTILIVLLLLPLLFIGAYVKGCCEEKGKQYANTSKHPNAQNEIIYQATEGDKSPIIVSDGDVRLEYGNDK